MNQNHQDVAVGVFADRGQAERAVGELRRGGFRNDQIGVVARGTQEKVGSTPPSGDNSAEGAVTGAVAGAAAGGLVGLGILAGVIPVIGPVIAGGTLAVLLANAAGGAAIAGVLGALVGLGIPEEEARLYEGEIQSGRTWSPSRQGTGTMKHAHCCARSEHRTSRLCLRRSPAESSIQPRLPFPGCRGFLYGDDVVRHSSKEQK